MTHTPGPWTSAPCTTKAGRDLLSIGAANRRLFDLRIYDDEDRANARLIAAAPDMLAALRIALNEVHHPGAAAYEQGRDIADILSAAIARATQEG